MVGVISSRTPEGHPFRCPICGLKDRIEPSITAGDALCPSCGHLVWPSAIDLVVRRSRALLENADKLLRQRSRRPMLGVVATVGRQIQRAWNGRPRREAREPSRSKSGVYDHWLDG